MDRVLVIGGFLALIGFVVEERRREHKFAWFTPEQVEKDRKQCVRADYRAQLERSWSERFLRFMRRVEVATGLAVRRTRPDE